MVHAPRLPRASSPHRFGKHRRQAIARNFQFGPQDRQHPTPQEPRCDESCRAVSYVMKSISRDLPRAGASRLDLRLSANPPPLPHFFARYPPRPVAGLARRDRQRPDPLEHRPKQASGQMTLRQQEPAGALVFHETPARLDEALLQAACATPSRSLIPELPRSAIQLITVEDIDCCRRDVASRKERTVGDCAANLEVVHQLGLEARGGSARNSSRAHASQATRPRRCDCDRRFQRLTGGGGHDRTGRQALFK